MLLLISAHPAAGDLARINPQTGAIALEEIARCVNQLMTENHHQCWDVDALENFIINALETLSARGIVPDSIGIDTGRGLCPAG